jgi:hypothetical protein
MRVETFQNLNLKPVKDLIAYEWKHLEHYGNIAIPDTHYLHRDLGPGILCIGKVLAVGPKVRHVSKGEYVLFSEYGADSGMYLESDKVYLTHEWEIQMMFKTMPQLLTPKRKED